jgi:hypothetical protein
MRGGFATSFRSIKPVNRRLKKRAEFPFDGLLFWLVSPMAEAVT